MTWDTLYYWYFAAHIPITLVMDSTIVVPPRFQLGFQKMLLAFHLRQNKDFLLVELPLWLRISGAFELFVQLPIFVLALYALRRKLVWIFPVIMVYGFNAFFTTLLCLAYIYTGAETRGLLTREMFNLLGLYVPYLVIPFFMMVECGLRVNKLMKNGKGVSS